MQFRQWFIWIIATLLIASLAATANFAKKTFRTYAVLETARVVQAPETAAIRGWMTLGYVASQYQLPLDNLLNRLGLPADTADSQTLHAIAESMNLSTPDYVLTVQRAIATHKSATPPSAPPAEPDDWFSRLTDTIYSALLTYGYPVLVSILFLGALGLPVPAGPLATIAGTLALHGQINGAVAAGLAVGASMLGDMAGYGAGRVLSPAFLDRHGHWVGYTPANRIRLQRWFNQWGGLMLIVTRSLTAHVGVIVSVFAGAGHYPVLRFFVYSIIGRGLWTASYFGLGYAVGTDFEAASGFLGYLSLLLIALVVSAISTGLLLRTHSRPG